MYADQFDALTKRLVDPTTRRGTLRLLAGGLLGGLLSGGGATIGRAMQRPDRDGDQLFDDDEVERYFTNPDLFDTDGDGAGDGLEVYNRDQGLGDPDDPLVPDNPNAPPPPPPAGGTDCLTNPDSCTIVGEVDNPAGNVDLTLTPICAPNRVLCGPYDPAYCSDIWMDSDNCGACGRRCQYPLSCCRGRCIDISSDPYNCGSCDRYCGGRACQNYHCV